VQYAQFVDDDAFVVRSQERDRTEAEEFDRLVASPLRELHENGRSDGRIRPDIPTAWLAESLVGIAPAALRQGMLGRDDTVATITSVLLDGALAAERPER
jgi:hypothetical protein